ncbi:hypothetical protein HWV62_8593 [Athelia sp. TMB]|nr:hypothetical protein HWV62_8593 [Athelia sp. TMB]
MRLTYLLQSPFFRGFVLGQIALFLLHALCLRYLPLYWRHPAEWTGVESVEWLNVLLYQVVDVYRSKLRDDLAGPEGVEVARRKVEMYANRMRPVNLLDQIKVHSVDLGASAPRLSNAVLSAENAWLRSPTSATLNVRYAEPVSIVLSTSYIVNFLFIQFLRVPVTLEIAVARFESSIRLTPPAPTAPAVFSIALDPDFTLDLRISSSVGAGVVKFDDLAMLHETIDREVRRALTAHTEWQIVLP